MLVEKDDQYRRVRWLSSTVIMTGFIVAATSHSSAQNNHSLISGSGLRFANTHRCNGSELGKVGAPDQASLCQMYLCAYRRDQSARIDSVSGLRTIQIFLYFDAVRRTED